MPSYCCVLSCTSNSKKDFPLAFFRFPVVSPDPKLREISINRRKQWLRAIRRDHDETKINNLRVCSKHFKSGKPAKLYDYKNPDWVPSRKLGCAVGTPVPSAGANRTLIQSLGAIEKSIQSVGATEQYERNRLRERNIELENDEVETTNSAETFAGSTVKSNSCCFEGCSSEKASLFRIPGVRNSVSESARQWALLRRKQWVRIIRRRTHKDFNVNNVRVCSKHFHSGRPASALNLDDPDWVPSLNLPSLRSFISKSVAFGDDNAESKKEEGKTQSEHVIDLYDIGHQEDDEEEVIEEITLDEETASTRPDETSTSIQLEEATTSIRPRRKAKRSVRPVKKSPTYILPLDRATRSVQQLDRATRSIVEEATTSIRPLDGPRTSISVQTEVMMESICEMTSKIRSCQAEISMHNEKLSLGFDVSGFIDNDDKTQYFTGLPNSIVLFDIFEQVCDKTVLLVDSELTRFQQFVLTLIKLRLDLDFQFLSYMFSISSFTATDTFYSTLNVLSERLRFSVSWPGRTKSLFSGDSLKENVDGNIVVTFDCIEIPCECSPISSSTDPSKSSSDRCDSVKYVLGLTTAESIIFISVSDGKSSAKSIVEDCGFLVNLKSGDVVITEKDYTTDNKFENDVSPFAIAAFVKKNGRLIDFDMDNFDNVSRIQSKCKTFFGSVKKKYRILNGPVKSFMLDSRFDNQDSILDQIVLVTCALNNLGKHAKVQRTIPVVYTSNQKT